MLEETHVRRKRLVFRAGCHQILIQTQLFVRTQEGPTCSPGAADLQPTSRVTQLTSVMCSLLTLWYYRSFLQRIVSKILEASSAGVDIGVGRNTETGGDEEALSGNIWWAGCHPSKPLGRAGCRWGKWQNFDPVTLDCFFRMS